MRGITSRLCEIFNICQQQCDGHHCTKIVHKDWLSSKSRLGCIFVWNQERHHEKVAFFFPSLQRIIRSFHVNIIFSAKRPNNKTISERSALSLHILPFSLYTRYWNIIKVYQTWLERWLVWWPFLSHMSCFVKLGKTNACRTGSGTKEQKMSALDFFFFSRFSF